MLVLGTFKSLMKESLARCAALRLLALHFPRSNAHCTQTFPMCSHARPLHADSAARRFLWGTSYRTSYRGAPAPGDQSIVAFLPQMRGKDGKFPPHTGITGWF